MPCWPVDCIFTRLLQKMTAWIFPLYPPASFIGLLECANQMHILSCNKLNPPGRDVNNTHCMQPFWKKVLQLCHNINLKDIPHPGNGHWDGEIYLGVHLNTLDWTDKPNKKGQSRLSLLRRLKPFGETGDTPEDLFCRGSNILTADKKRLNRLDKKASSVQGCPLKPVEVEGAKLSSLMENMSHPMQDTLTALGSSFRLLHPQCVKERYCRSFLSAAFNLYNQHCSQ